MIDKIIGALGLDIVEITEPVRERHIEEDGPGNIVDDYVPNLLL